MALPKSPDIPMPRQNDEGYMRLWHKNLQLMHDEQGARRERDAWRRAFYSVSAILLAVTSALIVTVCTMLMNII